MSVCKLAVFCAVAAGLIGPAAARDIVVGVEDFEYYPLYALRDGEVVGLFREVLDAFGRDKGDKIIYRPMPVKRLYAELAIGGIDVLAPDSPDWGQEAKAGLTVTYSAPLVDFIDGVMVRPGSIGKSIDDIHVLGIPAGFTASAWSERIAQNGVEISENPRMEVLLRQAAVGHLDGVYVNIAIARQVLKTTMRMPGALVFNPALPHIRGSYRLSTAKAPELIAEFNKWAEETALPAMISARLDLDRIE